MKIVLNGKLVDVQPDANIQQVMTSVMAVYGSYAVALNKTFIPRSQYADVPLKDGDCIDVIQPMQGG